MSTATAAYTAKPKARSNNSSKAANSSSKAKASPTKRPKIPAPYSSYTIFFRLERHHILQSLFDAPLPDSYDPAFHDVNEHPRPLKYVATKLPPYWYSSAHRAAEEKKRKHRKVNGETLSKEDLTSLIAARWKSIDAETLAYVERLSNIEKKRVQSLLLETSGGADDEDERSNFELPSLPLPLLPNRNPRCVTISNCASVPSLPGVGTTPFSLSHAAAAPPPPAAPVDTKRVPLKKRPIHLISPPASDPSELQDDRNHRSLPPSLPNAYRNMPTSSYVPAADQRRGYTGTEDDCFAAGVLHLIRYGSDASGRSV